MAQLILANGEVSLVDEEDFSCVSRYSWRLDRFGYVIRTKRGAVKKSRTTVFLHREIMKPPQDMQIDHINGNKRDNRRENLRIVTHLENSANRRIGGHGLGITKNGHSWQVAMTCAGEQCYLGLFRSKEEAAAALSGAAKLRDKIFGKKSWFEAYQEGVARYRSKAKP
jgi:hypothetical protein